VKKNPGKPLFLGTLGLDVHYGNHFPSWVRILGGIVLLLIVSLSLGEAAQSVKLAWDANSEPNIIGYVLRYGTSPGNPTQRINLGKNTTTATVSNLADGTTYFFTVTARNDLELESPPSNEVSYTTAPLGAHKLTVINGTGTGNYTEGTQVRVSANPPSADQRFDGWTRDWQILTNPFIPTTTALMLFRDLTIEPLYSLVSGEDLIRYYPRPGFTERMVGGVFEGTNGDPITETYIPIYTIKTNPQPEWSEVSVNLGNFRYLRYRGPNGSYGNVAEVEFYRKGVKVKGAGYGTQGSWHNNGNSFGRALDGDVHTRLDGPTADEVYVGIDTAPRDLIRYYPRPGFTGRMVSGVFEGTNGNPLTGTYTPIYTIKTNPRPEWSEVSVNLGNFRYLRYRGPNGSYGNVAEIEFYREGVKVKGAGYGTQGSWNNNGNSFGRALDGNVNTRFDGPTANGVYVGIDTAPPTSALLAGQ
jgi:hypothetical protein